MINYEAIEVYESCLSTFKEISIGGNENEPMTNLEIRAYDFDKVKDEYIKENNIKSKETYRSCDALYISKDYENRWCLIEFKSGKVKHGEIMGKIYESLLILTDILGTTISDTRKHFDFILVYDKDKNPESGIIEFSRRISSRAEEEYIAFKLDKFKGLYFKNVNTIDKDAFNYFFKKYSK